MRKNVAFVLITSLLASWSYCSDDSVAVIRPTISSDGKKIAFCYRQGDQTNIILYDLRSSSLKQLTTAAKNVNNYDPSFSPDGNSIVYSRSDGSASHIYIMNADGSNNRRVSNTKNYDAEPIFSPDAKKIFFTRANNYRPTSTLGFTWDDWDIYSINQDGTAEVRITKANFYELCCLSYSRLKETIFFSALESSWPPSSTIFSVKSDGTMPPLMVRREIDVINTLHSDVSTDGKKVAFVSRGTLEGFKGEFQIHLINSDGTDIQQLTRNSLWNNRPAFAPDGTKLYFISCSGDGDKCDLKQINIDGSAEALVLPSEK